MYCQDLLIKFQQHGQAWTRVDAVLKHSKSENTKFIVLQILADLIQYRWKILPASQQSAIKNYIINHCLTMSADEASLIRNKLILTKLNSALVQVRKI